MQEEEQRQCLERIKKCLSSLKKEAKFPLTVTVDEAQIFMDKLLPPSSDDTEDVKKPSPITPIAAEESFLEFCTIFPEELMKWFNGSIIRNFDPTNKTSCFMLHGVGAKTENQAWLTEAVLQVVFGPSGWTVEHRDGGGHFKFSCSPVKIK